MTVKELKAMLSRFDDNTEVHLAYRTGDYFGTVAAPEVCSVKLGHVRERADVGTALADPDGMPQRDWDQLREVLVLQGTYSY